jgi:hypothetical protein
MAEDVSDLVPSHDDRKPSRCPCPNGAIEAHEFSPQDYSVQKDEGGERLVLGGRGDVSLDGQVGEKFDDLRCTHFVGMPNAVIMDESTDPADVGVFGAKAHVADAQGRTNAVEQTRGAIGRKVVQRRLRPGPGGSKRRIPESVAGAVRVLRAWSRPILAPPLDPH